MSTYRLLIMEIRPIFVDQSGNGLHSFAYDKVHEHEYSRLIDAWTDTEYVTNYLVTNQKYLRSDFFKESLIDNLIDQIQEEAEETAETLLSLCSEAENGTIDLDFFFRPLNNGKHNLPLALSKGSIQRADFKNLLKRSTKAPILRLYAIRLKNNCFVITGGAIKLVKRIDQHPDLQEELRKINRCRDYLKENGLETADDLIYHYDENK